MHAVKNVCEASVSSFLLTLFYLDQSQMETAFSAQHLCHW